MAYSADISSVWRLGIWGFKFRIWDCRGVNRALSIEEDPNSCTLTELCGGNKEGALRHHQNQHAQGEHQHEAERSTWSGGYSVDLPVLSFLPTGSTAARMTTDVSFALFHVNIIQLMNTCSCSCRSSHVWRGNNSYRNERSPSELRRYSSVINA